MTLLHAVSANEHACLRRSDLMSLIADEALTPEERTTKVTFYHKACDAHTSPCMQTV